MQPQNYPVEFSVAYPARALNRVTTVLRLFTVIPIAIVLGSVSGGTWQSTVDDARVVVVTAGGLLVAGPLLMILFRQKYPRWWFDWNLELQRFSNRVVAYVALMDDRYPSTDEHQSVRLDYPYPDATRLNRFLPLVKWLLAIPHYVVGRQAAVWAGRTSATTAPPLRTPVGTHQRRSNGAVKNRRGGWVLTGELDLDTVEPISRAWARTAP